MIKTCFLAAAAGLCLSPLAAADHSVAYVPTLQAHASGCAAVDRDRRTAGALIGAVAGGLLGVAIADDDDRAHHRHRRYRSYRHGHHGHGQGHEVAGALIGGVLGAVIGSEIAASGTDCNPKWNPAEIPPPTRAADGPAWNAPPRTLTYGAPPRSVMYTSPVPSDALLGAPDAAVPAPAPVSLPDAGPAPAMTSRECQLVQRETVLADGTRLREPVNLCRGATGTWEIDDTPLS